jgi:hypothetical protein
MSPGPECPAASDRARVLRERDLCLLKPLHTSNHDNVFDTIPNSIRNCLPEKTSLAREDLNNAAIGHRRVDIVNLAVVP